MIDPDELSTNPSANSTFDEVLEARFSRRALMGGGLVAAAGVAVVTSGAAALVDAVPADAALLPGRQPVPGPLLGFQGIATSTADTVVVPPGYSTQVVISWGDPVSDGPAFKEDGSNTAAEQAQQWGMHNDGIVYFPFPNALGRLPVVSAVLKGLGLGVGLDHGLIVENNEYVDEGLLFADGIANWSAEKSAKVLAAHGVSIIEVKRNKQGGWYVVRPSKFARRITGNTAMAFSGPAAGHPLLQTSYDPEGLHPIGTINNCAMGYTPWGTYLTCEENFNGYFKKDAPLNPLESRYGIGPSGPGNRLYTTDHRFHVDEEPNEPNRFGWVVEIDPFKPSSTPVKRTALGRIKHEGAWVQEARDGRVVVYMGDDQVFEYIYRYVSRQPWRDAIAQGVSPLDDGQLYVARFNPDGTGDWLPITKGNAIFDTWTEGDLLVKTRQAADLLGATKMDRPEWIDTIPSQLVGLATLTNNSSRGVGSNPATDPANPRATNRYGQIIRWKYTTDFTEPTFTWDLFALAGDPSVPAQGSTINGDKYGSPDGLYIAPSGRMWIQTDVSTSTINAGAYAGFGNNQMLCADPVTKETRRFLVGPKQCEITGVFATPDETTLFVGIQHPGERPDDAPANPANPKEFSSWPGGAAGGRPRSSLIAVTKNDGGKIGS